MLRADRDGATLSLSDESGKTRALLTVHQQESNLSLLDKESKPRTTPTAAENGPGLAPRDDKGDLRVVEKDLREALKRSTHGAEPGGAAAPDLSGLTLSQAERLLIQGTLAKTGGNREKTAALLQIGARTLYRKLQEYGLR